MFKNAIIKLGDNMIGSRSRHSSHMSARRRHMSAHRSAASRHRSATSRRHGISNAHAFAVGRATGVNINGSHMGAHGAALHRSAERRKDRRHSSLHSSHHFRNGTSNFSGTTNFTGTNVLGTKTALAVMGGVFTLFAIMSVIIFLIIAFVFISFVLPHIS